MSSAAILATRSTSLAVSKTAAIVPVDSTDVVSLEETEASGSWPSSSSSSSSTYSAGRLGIARPEVGEVHQATYLSLTASPITLKENSPVQTRFAAMSGVEAAGLILAAIPLVISLGENYAEGFRTIKRWRKYDRELKSLCRRMRSEEELFRN
ncbi:hypothetical protein E6O75_ATG06761 [Venturia nashicola]|uniref:Uncharacterized protein n=1 Tax=Venturia nashicola TaxID=86259 RepID=A0A4Z1P4Z7_9PEZI|nr:hypothetical protein E6O75_ATG06761 [Venturia nashicola]